MTGFQAVAAYVRPAGARTVAARQPLTAFPLVSTAIGMAHRRDATALHRREQREQLPIGKDT
jgi:hypothetical protein